MQSSFLVAGLKEARYSCYAENDSQIGILMAGNFLAKPFRPAALIAKVQSILAV